MMMRQIFIALMIAAFCSAAQFAKAQTEPTLYFMNSLPQVVYTNPAAMPKYKFSLGLPGSSIYGLYANNGFRYNDLTVAQGDSTVADMNKFYGALKKKNYLTFAAQGDLFRLSLKVNPRIYFTYNLSTKTFNRTMIPKGLTAIFSEGTSVLVSQTTNISPLTENMAYIESSWGASYVVDKNLTVGMHLKLLKGAGNVTTNKSIVNLTIGDDYQVTAVADIDAKTSGIHNFDEVGFKVEDHWRDYLKNTGFAIDLGALYKINDRLTVGASLIDIGSITWKNDLYGYRLNPEKANYTFEGVSLQKLIDGDEEYLDDTADSLEENFDFEEGRIAKYRTPIPGKIYFSGNYEIKKNLFVGALLFAEKFRGRFAPGFSATVHKEFGRRFSTSLSYTITQRAFNNLGLGLSLNLPPIQIYLVGDNLLRAPFALAADGNLNSFVNNTRYFNVRAGLNFVFGWDKDQE
ncbi:MAG: DUF5723 family protein, partial [Bacteroidota bacterium]